MPTTSPASTAPNLSANAAQAGCASPSIRGRRRWCSAARNTSALTSLLRAAGLQVVDLTGATDPAATFAAIRDEEAAAGVDHEEVRLALDRALARLGRDDDAARVQHGPVRRQVIAQDLEDLALGGRRARLGDRRVHRRHDPYLGISLQAATIDRSQAPCRGT